MTLDLDKLERLEKLCRLPPALTRDGKNYLVPYVNLLWGAGFIRYGINFKSECGEAEFENLDQGIQLATALWRKMRE